MLLEHVARHLLYCSDCHAIDMSYCVSRPTTGAIPYRPGTPFGDELGVLAVVASELFGIARVGQAQRVVQVHLRAALLHHSVSKPVEAHLHLPAGRTGARGGPRTLRLRRTLPAGCR